MLIPGITICIIISSCTKNDVFNPEAALLKTKYWYLTRYETIPYKTTKYKYDSHRRLERINHYTKDSDLLLIYELLEYNADNEIVNKYTFHYANDSIGWLLNDSSEFTYDNGELIEEMTCYPSPNSYRVSFYYEYDHSLVISKARYDNGKFEYCIQYEYENGICTKETRYSDIDLSIMAGYTIHYYEDELLIRSEKFTSQNQNFQVILYSYDPHGNLTTEESVGTYFPVVAPVEYFYRYEYY